MSIPPWGCYSNCKCQWQIIKHNGHEPPIGSPSFHTCPPDPAHRGDSDLSETYLWPCHPLAWAKSSAASMIDLRPLPIPGDLPGPGHCLLLRLSNNCACCPHSPALAPVNLNYLQCQPVSSFLGFAQASPSQNALSNFLPFFGKLLCLF